MGPRRVVDPSIISFAVKCRDNSRCKSAMIRASGKNASDKDCWKKHVNPSNPSIIHVRFLFFSFGGFAAMRAIIDC
jgi:hypothetical protein